MRKGAYLLNTFIIRFKGSYHVGWRRPQPIIESVTIHRALIDIIHELYGKDISPKIINDIMDAKISSLLPAVKTGDCHKTLVPFTHFPSKIKLNKIGINWISLKALSTLLFYMKNVLTMPYLYIEENAERKIFLNYKIDSKEHSEEIKDLVAGKNLIYHKDEMKIFGEVSLKLFRLKEIWRNVIDRVTSSADLYKIYVYDAETDLAMIIYTGSKELSDSLDEILMLLGVTGLGGLRSYGFGKFVASRGEICKEDLYEDYEKIISWKGPGFYVSLGSFLDYSRNIIDLDKSIINKGVLEGFAGSAYNSYHLPKIIYAASGSILYLRDKPDKEVIKIDTKDLFEPLIIFNPVMIGV